MDTKKQFIDEPFVMIPKRIFSDNTVSMKAKAVYCYILCRINDAKSNVWRFNIYELEKRFIEKKQAINNAIQELIEKEYIIKKSLRYEGRYVGITYIPVVKTKIPEKDIEVVEDVAPLVKKEIDLKELPDEEVKEIIAEETLLEEESEREKSIANMLKIIVEEKLNRKIVSANWYRYIAKMHTTDKISYEDIEQTILWYKDHYNDKYCPVVLSAQALREKYLKLQNAIMRDKNSYRNNDIMMNTLMGRN